MQRDMRVETEQTQQESRADSQKGWNRFVAKTGEYEVEPDNIRLLLTNGAKNLERSADGVEFPAPNNVEVRKFLGRFVHLIRQHGQADQIVLPQFLGKMEPVLVQSLCTWGKSRYQTNFHRGPFSQPQPQSVSLLTDVPLS